MQIVIITLSFSGLLYTLTLSVSLVGQKELFLQSDQLTR